MIVPKKEDSPDNVTEQSEAAPEKLKNSKRKSWAELLARVFSIDALRAGARKAGSPVGCPGAGCGGKVTVQNVAET